MLINQMLKNCPLFLREQFKEHFREQTKCAKNVIVSNYNKNYNAKYNKPNVRKTQHFKSVAYCVAPSVANEMCEKRNTLTIISLK